MEEKSLERRPKATDRQISRMIYCEETPSNNSTNHAGKRYGYLVAIKIVGVYVITDTNGKQKKRRVWLCQCDCGNTIEVIGNRLTNKSKNSCGCQKSENTVLFNKATKRKPVGDSVKHQRYLNYANGAKKRGYAFNLTQDDFVSICEKNCFYCDSPPSSEKKLGAYSVWVSNGIDRVDNSEGYVLQNVVPCCWVCNKMKGSFSVDEFLNNCKKVAAKALVVNNTRNETQH